MIKAPPTPKGFRDIKPDLAKKRRETIDKIVSVLEQYGFVPIETPTIEFAQTLEGKYGEEERLIYKFTDRGGRKLALRYDLTVPLARYVATYNPPLPFRRYQIGQVFRGENPQKGRWREFTQFDFDTVGSNEAGEDAKVLAVAIKCTRELGFKNALMLINDRANFANFPTEVIRAIDKLYKIGDEGVIQELISNGLSQATAKEYISKIRAQKPTQNLQEIFKILEDTYSLKMGEDFIFDPTLARGLDYYTGAIFELKPSQNPTDLTIGSGGRYDNLIGMFAKKDIPAVGFSFGLDRLLEILYP
ncbi:ATP phosphoribosyltransferase regulatory subunit [Candidatus Daviesbacteria bacterium]|nr:ATP phosphoribosyltransferase regulatory subunit [Candidatus Daviesbacteria bacterium]